MESLRAEDWTCRECGDVQHRARAGARCPRCHAVLVPARELEQFPHDRVLGKVVERKYAVVGILGSGGFGTVYRAVQEPVGREVALKLVHAQHADDPDLRARFFREARIVARLTDPTVVTLFDYGDAEGLGLFTAFELVEGETLKAYLRQGPQEPIWVAHVMVQLLGALAEAHALGMVHRDLKPANVMIIERSDGERRVRLLDFGIAKMLPSEDIEQSVKTQQGVVIGTPEYLSPEQARARDTVDARSDLYSLGVLGYTLLAGKNPFSRGTVIDTILAHCSAQPPPLDPALGVPSDLEAVVGTALAKEPEDRFQTASAMCAAIRDAFPQVSFGSGTTPSPRGTTGSGPSRAEPVPAASAAGTSDARGGSNRRPAAASASAAASAPVAAAAEPAMAAHESGPFTSGASAASDVAPPRRRLVWVLALAALLLVGGATVWALVPENDGITSRPLERRAAPAEPRRGAPEGSSPTEAASDPIGTDPLPPSSPARAEDPPPEAASPASGAVPSPPAPEASDAPDGAPTARTGAEVPHDAVDAPPPTRRPARAPARPTRRRPARAPARESAPAAPTAPKAETERAPPDRLRVPEF